MSYSTERTRRFRAQELDGRLATTLSHIEQHGCSVICVSPGGSWGWSYTVGVYDTCGQPELIVIGLKREVAHYLLNEAVDRLRSGISLAESRQSDLLDEVQCEFRAVDRKWIDRTMGICCSYYGGAEFPVLQAVYPDRADRFPEGAEFDSNFAQPLLQPGASFGANEQEFWDSTDPASSLFNWKFPDPPHTRVFLSEAVHSGAEPVTYVSHDAEDGAWQFLGDSMSDGKRPVLSCFHHPVDRDRSLEELADLPLGWWAERTAPGEPWIRRQHDTTEPAEEDC